MHTFYHFQLVRFFARRLSAMWLANNFRRSARTILVGIILVTGGGMVRAADLVLSVVAPAESVPAGQFTTVNLLAVNPSPRDLPFDPVATFEGRMFVDKAVRKITFHLQRSGASVVQSGAFASRSYTFAVPPDLTGRAVLEIEIDAVTKLSAVIEIETASNTPAGTRNVSALLSGATPADEAIANRVFAGRLSPNEPVYFIYGSGKHAAAKFQFSFNYRLGSFTWADESTSRIQVGYTQRSLWDIHARSSPFYDTSYMPEISIDKMARVKDTSDGGVTWIGMMGGIKHESNGRDGLESRSMNTIYARAAFAVGRLESWHVVFVPEVFTYYTDLGDNDTIKDYRGYGRFRAILGKTNGPSLLTSVWSGKDMNHFTSQFDLSYPLRTHFLKIESFMLLQYFDGYGESLKDYDKRSTALRIGMELVR